MSNRFRTGVLLTLGVGAAFAVAVVKPAIGQDRDVPIVFPAVINGQYGDLPAVVSALSKPRSSDDELAGSALEMFSRLVSIGRVDASASARSRRILETGAAGPLWIVPASNGFAYLTNDTAGIVPGVLGREMPAAGATIKRRASEPARAFGIVSDDVVAVEVIANGAVTEATLLGNGYSWEAEDSSLSLENISIRVRLNDGILVSL